MTLGLSKTKLFGFKKHESKKRKIDEKVMNGLPEDDIQSIGLHSNVNNNRFDSQSYETPSKRPRIPSNSLNTTVPDVNRSFSIRDMNPIPMIQSLFQKLGNTWKSGERQPNPEMPSVGTSRDNNPVIQMPIELNSNEMNFSIKPTVNTNEVIFVPQNQMTVTTESFTSTQTKSSDIKRKRHFITKDRRDYQKLLDRHLGPNNRFTSNPRKFTKPVEFIDLCRSEDSNNRLINPNMSQRSSQSIQLSDKCDRKVLDNKDRETTVLVERIKSRGVISNAINEFKFCGRKSFNPVYSSTPKENVFATPKANPFSQQFSKNVFSAPKANTYSQQLSKNVVSVYSVPESTKRFNELASNKNYLLDNKWISDLREGIAKEAEKREQKLSKSEQTVSDYKNKRETDFDNLGPKLRIPLNRTELSHYIPFISFDEIEEEVEESDEEIEETIDFPTLTPDMEKRIDDALRPTPPKQVLSEGFQIEITRKDMETLKGLNWLNDEIINFYMSLIVDRSKNDNFSTCYAFNTFFYKKLKDEGYSQGLKRWTRKVDIFKNDFIFIPIHLGMHWCLAVIDFINKRIDYYDSMGGKNQECVEALKRYVQSESLDKKKVEFPMTDWKLEMVSGIPQQMNGSDCGMFTCKYAEYISRKARINFSQAHMPYFRRRMVYEILIKQLL